MRLDKTDACSTNNKHKNEKKTEFSFTPPYLILWCCFNKNEMLEL